jgi:ribosomal protein S18 acetylase RimI-like enzyme
MIQVKKVTGNLLGKCRRFLAQNPVSNVLPLTDCYSPLLKASTLYCAIDDDEIMGVCSVYKAFVKPSVVLGVSATEVKKALLEKALLNLSGEFISLCEPDEIAIFAEHAALLNRHSELQMVASPPRRLEFSNIRVERVRRDELEMLDGFYVEHGAEAWTPLQFEAGPFYCVKQDGRIVSVAGVHALAPQIAQLGNIFTDEAYRGRGFATACTSTLAKQLSARGRIVSLFVKTENSSAIHLYEKLGFPRKREIAFVTMQKR